MKNHITSCVCILISLFSVAACTEKHMLEYEYLAFDNREVGIAPQVISTLKEGEGDILFSNKSIQDFLLTDSLILIETGNGDGMLELVSRKSLETLYTCLASGNGEFEFPRGINLDLYTTLRSSDDSLFLDIYEGIKGNLFALNITESLQNKHTCISKRFHTGAPAYTSFWGKTVGDSLLIVKELTDMETRQTRNVYKNGEMSDHNLLEALNRVTLPAGEDFNLLSSLFASQPGGSRCVEVLIGLNYINIYSMSDEWCKTVCEEEEMASLSEVLSTSRANRRYLYAAVKSYPFGFAVLKHDITEKEYQQNSDYTVSVVIYNWNGDCLGEIQSDFKFTAFDIDPQQEYVYVLDAEGRLQRYPIDLKI